jgi:predicted lactoylglutathione lyase
MVALRAKTQDEVRAAHATALKNSGSDEGAPGPRPADAEDYYGAYMRDPTGNKLCIYWKP